MLNSVDLFTGIGGFALAFRDAFRPLLYCDSSPGVRALLTRLMASKRLPRAPIVHDVTDLPAIVDAVKGRRVDLVTAGFPCIGFSASGNKRGFDDANSRLFFRLVKVVAALRPGMVLMENVDDIVTLNGGADLRTIERAFKRLGYSCAWTVVSAQSVGAPQLRRRWFCVCWGKGHLKGADELASSRWSWSPSNMPAIVAPRAPDFASRFSMLGNAVVPAAAVEAFRRLCFGAPVTDRRRPFPKMTVSATHYAGHTDASNPPSKPTARRFPTPRARMWNRSKRLTERTMDDLPTFALYLQQIGGRRLPRTAPGAAVNPCFVEWLMGYPKDWTAGGG